MGWRLGRPVAGAKARVRSTTRLVMGSDRRGGAETGPEKYRLIIYSKPGCDPCQVLKRKIKGLIDRAEFVQSILSQATLEERNIKENYEWMAEYGESVPVLKCLVGGEEVTLPRLNHRGTADRIEKHLEELLSSLQ